MAEPRSTMIDPPIETLLDTVDSKFTLVTLASKRARQINSYFNQLGEGLGAIVPAPGQLGGAQAALDRPRGDRRGQGARRRAGRRGRVGTPAEGEPAEDGEGEPDTGRRSSARPAGEPVLRAVGEAADADPAE